MIGAGLIGTAIAYELALRGATVTVFDRGEPGRAASWAGAGMLAPYSEGWRDPVLQAFGRASLARYPDFVAELRERTGIDAHLRGEGTVHVALDDPALARLLAGASAIMRGGGKIEIFDRARALEREPVLRGDAVGALFVANEGQVDNRRLGRALVAAATALGVRFERADELRLECDARRVRGIATERGFLAVPTAINAAGAWAGEIRGVPVEARVPVAPVAGEMLALGVPPGLVRALIWHEGVYLVPREDGRLLIGATVVERGFDARVTAGGLHALLRGALEIAPALADFAVVETWAGLRPGSPDGRPFVGTTALDGYLVAAGHHRNGILLTPITAHAIAGLVLDGRTDLDLAPFSPSRAAPERVGAAAKEAP